MNGESIKKIEKLGVLPVLNVKKDEWTLPLAQALCDGGLPAIEVLARSEGAMERMQRIKQAHPEMEVGAGTILTLAQAKAAIEAGADFIVSPGYDPQIVELCLQSGVDVVPGCTSASEIQLAYSQGLRVMKFFPVEACGGLAAIRELTGPFPGVRYLPTGGITLDTLGSYLASPSIAACGGSFVAPKALLEREDFAAIRDICRKARRIALGFSLAHVGVNHPNRAEAEKSAQRLCALLGLEPVAHSTCVFAGSAVECNAFEGLGEKGHIGIRTSSMLRACAWLEEQGVPLREEGRKYNAAGELTCVYLQEKIAGFAVHIVQA